MVETLIAIAMLAATLVLFHQSLGLGRQAVGRANLEAAAVDLAEARLAAAGIETPLEAGASEGADGPLRWRVKIGPYAPPLQPGAAAEGHAAWWVTVEVAWRHAAVGGERGIVLRTVKLGDRRQ